VGDLKMDIDLGKTLSCRTILIKDSSPAADNNGEAINADTIASDLLEAAQIILKEC